MPTYPFVAVDVFTDQRFGGNPLAVFTDARGMSDADMQRLAREFNYSESTFVLPPDDPAHTARVRIFTPAYEMPFAGHPNVGTGFVLAGMGRDTGGKLVFEEIAGLVEVTIERDGSGAITGATIAAPQPLSLGQELSVEAVAACAGLAPADVIVTAHRPVQATVGVAFVFAQVTGEALTRATPNVAAFREAEANAAWLKKRLSLHLYAHDGERIRTRMFAPLGGTFEDPATGSANATLGALLLSLGKEESRGFDIVQGVEMKRPSRLKVVARRAADGIRSTVAGGCVPVFKGEATLG